METAITGRWYDGVTKTQWLVLAIASAGWIFDAFEGQLFNLTRADLLSELLHVRPEDPAVKQWGDTFLGIFLAGGTVGGWLFSSLADKWGRKPVMMLTILFYSVFSGLTALSHELWQVGGLRFLVAMGVGGEWAVAAALVSEVFPAKARAQACGIFHASSVLGLWSAALVAMAVASNWRWAYVVGLLPALLVLWVRVGIKEPESWTAAHETKPGSMGSYRELLGQSQWRKSALLGMLMAMVGMATFWGVTVAGQDLCKDVLMKSGMAGKEAAAKAKFAYGIVQTTGGGLGLICFGPLSAWLGRRKAFAVMHAAALVVVPITCFWATSYTAMLFMLPVFGFFTLGIHAGYAVYFPELFPNHLRATGAGFCFNTGRLLAAPMLFMSGTLKATLGIQSGVALLAGFFALGLILVVFLSETKNRPLPD
jgi:MFS family permease